MLLVWDLLFQTLNCIFRLFIPFLQAKLFLYFPESSLENDYICEDAV